MFFLKRVSHAFEDIPANIFVFLNEVWPKVDVILILHPLLEAFPRNLVALLELTIVGGFGLDCVIGEMHELVESVHGEHFG